MISIQARSTKTIGNYKEPKQYNFITSGKRPFEETLLTQIRQGKKEYVARYDQVQTIRALLIDGEQITVMQVDGMYELSMKRRKK